MEVDVKGELTGRARRKNIKMRVQPASMIILDNSDARLNVAEFVEKRRDELDKMLKIIDAPPATRTALQRISRCKRRRAAAHNMNRLPKSVRNLIHKDHTERKTLSGYKRRKILLREKILNGEQISEQVGKPNRLSTHKWFSKRFHMIEIFGWNLPLCPTEKKLKQCMKVCTGKIDGIVCWDMTWTKTFGTSFTGSKFVLIGNLSDDFVVKNESLVSKTSGRYHEVNVPSDESVSFITNLVMSKQGHMVGLEMWNLHRCAAGRATYPYDFPETQLGAEYIRNELSRIDKQSSRKPKAKNKYFTISLTQNIDKKIPSIPQLDLGDDPNALSKVRLVSDGRGKLEKFAIVASFDESKIENFDQHSVLAEKTPVLGDFEGIGMVTSAAEDYSIGRHVGIGIMKCQKGVQKVFYRSLHWKHWRIATVEPIDNCTSSFDTFE